MNYADIMNSFRASKQRVEKLIAASNQRVDKLLRASNQREDKLNSALAEEKGNLVNALAEEKSKLQNDCTAEQAKQTQLMSDLETTITEATGQEVQIGHNTLPSRRVPTNPQYDRQAIISRIVELRDGTQKSFDAIATTLNDEGYKPKSAKAFTTATVYQLYKTRTALASAA